MTILRAMYRLTDICTDVHAFYNQMDKIADFWVSNITTYYKSKIIAQGILTQFSYKTTDGHRSIAIYIYYLTQKMLYITISFNYHLVSIYGSCVGAGGLHPNKLTFV